MFSPGSPTPVFFACSNGEQAKGETLVKINDYDLSFGEFHRQLARELNFNEDLKLTRKVREAFLEQLIQEELLIQEAFRKAIWYFQFRLEIENANKKILKILSNKVRRKQRPPPFKKS